MKLYLIGGFLGSGKTTAIRNGCTALMKEGLRTAVITNDQGEQLVDTGYILRTGIPVKEVPNGCFCCNFQQLEGALADLYKADQPDVIFAESVGSCTDLVATVAKPLQKFYLGIHLVISVFADATLLRSLISGTTSFLNDEVRYIYKKQLAEADVLILNKTDLLSDSELDEVQQVIKEEFPHKTILHQNSNEDKDVQQWLTTLDGFSLPQKRESLEVDYSTYAKGEAALAWLDEALLIRSNDNRAYEYALMLIGGIEQRIRQQNHTIGHLKFLLNNGVSQRKISFTGVPAGEEEALKNDSSANEVSVLVNARVQTHPSVLEEIISSEIKALNVQTGCTIAVKKLSSFQPGYPKPTYRMAD